MLLGKQNNKKVCLPVCIAHLACIQQAFGQLPPSKSGASVPRVATLIAAKMSSTWRLALQDELEEMSAVDRLRRVEPFWKQLSHEERLELMTFSTKEVKAQAVTVTRKLERDAEGKSILRPVETCKEYMPQIVTMLTHHVDLYLVHIAAQVTNSGHKQRS